MEEEGAEPDMDFKMAFAVWDGARAVVRRIPAGRKFLRAVRRRRDAEQFRRLHLNVFHTMRALTVAMTRPNWQEDAIIRLANDLCTELNNAMIDRFALQPHDMHCCWKVLGPSADPFVKTFARSRPFDEARPAREATAFDGCKSSICAALNGWDDGVTRWQKVPCFCSNNLPKYSEEFVTSRTDWKKYYKSTLVFPLRYVRDVENQDLDEIGYLAFNSHKVKAFPDVPEIFEYRTRPSEYRNALDRSPTFHLGAIFADTLSAHLYGVYRDYNVHVLEKTHDGAPRIDFDEGAPVQGGDRGDDAERG